jgi:hypothetical protein
MVILRAFLYLLAVILVALAAFGVGGRVSLALLGAAAFVLAFALPDIAAAF